MPETENDFGQLVPEPKVIDSIKGKKGGKDVYFPVDETGRPLIKGEEPIASYDNKGRKKKKIFPNGKVVDTEI